MMVLGVDLLMHMWHVYVKMVNDNMFRQVYYFLVMVLSFTYYLTLLIKSDTLKNEMVQAETLIICGTLMAY